MKISNSNTSTVSTNNDNATSYEFSIGDVSTIIDILRNRLYSNPIRTLTQEYLSNARDAHREANNEAKPVKVTLPTKLDSVLKIRDYGVGLSKDRVRDVFVNYGISTKRTDNVQTGGFGLGAKSAWAYTDSFTVTSYFNGVCSTYVAHTGNSHNGTFELINESPTNEPNGVEIQIPVKEADISKFVDAVFRTTMFWTVRPDLHGITEVEIPKEYKTPAIKYQNDKIMIVDNNHFNQNVFETRYVSEKVFVLIDKIPYSIAKFQYDVGSLRKLTELVQTSNMIFIDLPNGAVDVAASREEVSNDKKNISKLETMCAESVNHLYDMISKEFDKEFKDLHDYLDVYDGVRETFKANHVPKNLLTLEYSYEDVKFEMTDSFKNIKCDKILGISKFSIEEQKTRHVMRCTAADMLHMDGDNVKIVIADVNVGDSVLKKKIRKLLDENGGESIVYFVTVMPSTSEDYVEKVAKATNALFVSDLDYESVTVKAKKRLEGIVNIRKLFVDNSGRHHKIASEGKKEMTLEQIEREGKYVIVPFSGDEAFDYNNHQFVRMVTHLIRSGFTVIKCSKKDHEELSDVDNVYEYEDVVNNLEANVPLTNTAIEDCVYSSLNKNLFGLRRYKDQINCPKIRELLELYPTRNERGNYSPEILEHYAHYKVAKATVDKINKLETKVVELYPLLQNVNNYYYGNRENGLNGEYVYYINSKYSSKN
jgi:hypothetical protein